MNLCAIPRRSPGRSSRSGLFLNSSSDATLLPLVLEAASAAGGPPPSGDAIEEDVARWGIEPLFERDVLEDV